MVDWWDVICDGLWISGLSTVLAAVSYVHWWAREQRMSLRQAIVRREFRFHLIAGTLLISLGLLATSQLWWERIGWGVVVFLLLWRGLSNRRERSAMRKLS